MAEPEITQPSSVADERERPVRAMVALVLGFLALVAIATWTVLVPELGDDAAEEERGAPGSEAPSEGSAAPPAT